MDVTCCHHQRLLFSLDTSCMETCAYLWTGESLQGTTRSAYVHVHQATSCSSISASATHQSHFLHLKARANFPQFQDLVDSMDRQWFRNHLSIVHDWSVFQRTIRSNNDVECNKIICLFLIFELINLPFRDFKLSYTTI